MKEAETANGQALAAIKRRDEALTLAQQAQVKHDQISGDLASAEKDYAQFTEAKKAAADARNATIASEGARRTEETKAATARAEFEQLTLSLRSLRAEQDKLTKTLTEGPEARVATAQAAERKATEQVAVLNTQQEHLKTSVDSLTTEMSRLEDRRNALAQSNAKIEIAAANVAALSQQALTLKGEIETLTQRLTEATKSLGGTGDVRAAIVAGQAKATALANQAESLRAEIAALEARGTIQQAAEVRAQEARLREAAITVSIEQLSKHEADLKAEIKRLETLRTETQPK